MTTSNDYTVITPAGNLWGRTSVLPHARELAREAAVQCGEATVYQGETVIGHHNFARGWYPATVETDD